jgi:hypothetical protein
VLVACTSVVLGFARDRQSRRSGAREGAVLLVQRLINLHPIPSPSQPAGWLYPELGASVETVVPRRTRHKVLRQRNA